MDEPQDEYKGFAVEVPDDRLEEFVQLIVDNPPPIPPGGWPDDRPENREIVERP